MLRRADLLGVGNSRVKGSPGLVRAHAWGECREGVQATTAAETSRSCSTHTSTPNPSPPIRPPRSHPFPPHLCVCSNEVPLPILRQGVDFHHGAIQVCEEVVQRLDLLSRGRFVTGATEAIHYLECLGKRVREGEKTKGSQCVRGASACVRAGNGGWVGGWEGDSSLVQ